MADIEVFICLMILAIVTIPVALWYVITASRDIDAVIRRCDSLKRWAKENLDEKKGSGHG